MLVSTRNRSYMGRGGMMGYGSLGMVRGGADEPDPFAPIPRGNPEVFDPAPRGTPERRQPPRRRTGEPIRISIRRPTTIPTAPPVPNWPTRPPSEWPKRRTAQLPSVVEAAPTVIPSPARRLTTSAKRPPGATVKFLKDMASGYLDQGIPIEQIPKKVANVWYDSAVGIGTIPTDEQYEAVIHKAALQLGQVVAKRNEQQAQAALRAQRRTTRKSAAAAKRTAIRTLPPELKSPELMAAKLAIQDLDHLTLPQAILIDNYMSRTKGK